MNRQMKQNEPTSEAIAQALLDHALLAITLEF